MIEAARANARRELLFFAGPPIAVIAVFAALAWPNGPAAVLPFAVIAIVVTFTGLRSLRRRNAVLAMHAAAEARFRAAVDALSDGVAIFDAEDRLSFFNRCYPNHCAVSMRGILAIGERFEDLLRRALEIGPIYHRDMGEDFVERRLSLHRSRPTEHDQHLADGRWLRISEAPTPDGGRIILISDVTAARRREEDVRMLAAAVEQVGNPVEITSAAHGFVYVNAAFEAATGWRREEVLGSQPQEILASGAHPPEFFADILDRLESGKDWHGAIVNRHRDGGLIEQDMTISPLRGPDGAISHYVAVKRDVTDARRQARALAESEARLRAVLATQTEFVTRVRPNGEWTYMNAATERHLGMTLEELNARGIRDPDLILPEDLPLYHAHVAQLTSASPEHSVELRSVLPSGKVVWEQWTDTGIFDEDGRLTEIQCVGRSIGDRKQAELEREEAERLRLAALEAALDCYVSIDAQGVILEWNAASERTFGYSRESAVGRPMLDLIVPPHLRAAHQHGMTRRLDGGASTLIGRRIEVDAMRSDGAMFPIELIIVQGARASGTIFIAYLRDLSGRRAAEQALAEREAQFRTIAESVPVGLIISEFETGEPLYINPKARTNLGLKPGEQAGPLLAVWENPEDRAALMRELHERGAVSGLEATLIMLDGRRMTALVSATRIAYGGREAMLAVTVDISESRATEAALRESQMRLRAFMDFVPVAAHLRDADGRYLMINREMEDVIGLPAERALGRRPADFASPELIGNSDIHHRVVVETGQVHTSEQHLKYLSGPYNWVMEVRFPILDTAGQVSAVGTFAVDITERKRVEAELKASEARLSAIIAANPVPMNIARLSDRVFVFVNEPYLDLFGLRGVDLSRFDRDLLYADPAERDWIYSEIAAGRDVNNFELILRRTDGARLNVSITSRHVMFDGEPALVTSSIDQTNLRAAELEIERQREVLHQSEKLTALGSLLAGVAHELNNPLSVVVGYSSMLRELTEDEATRHRVDRIHAAAERCARIVRTFLAMARARPPVREPVAVGEVITGALDFAAYGLRGGDIAVEIDIPQDLPLVWADPDQLHQVLLNLLVNAQHALVTIPPPRRLTVRAGVSDGGVWIEVADNGPGMDADVVKRAFEPFFTTKPQGAGTGVGLSVCHGIVAAHGGRIDLVTAPGQGACFRFSLSIAAEDGPRALVEQLHPPATGRVLVVDDEPDILSLLAEHLARNGLVVETAASGRRALEALAARVFDAVVCDLRMPDMDGRALLGAIDREWPTLAGKVVLITGDALSLDLDRLPEGDVPIFEKPLDLDALTAAIRQRITGRPS